MRANADFDHKYISYDMIPPNLLSLYWTDQQHVANNQIQLNKHMKELMF